MPELSLVGLSEDGRSLVFSAGADETFSVRIDERLRAAVVSDRVRLGQLELERGTALRPKDIQSRIRSGERLEDVAAAAGVTPERIMTYAAPVLSERAHIATQARRSVLRRTEPTGPRALAEAVADRLRQRGVQASAVAWDAWRRDDGKWTISAAYRSGELERTALFAFDPLGRVVVAADDEARWLAGEGQLHGPQPRTTTRDSDGGGRSGSDRASGESRLSLVAGEGDRPELFDQDAEHTSAKTDRLAADDATRRADEHEDRSPTVSMAPVPPAPDPDALTFDETRPEPSPATDTGDPTPVPADLAADEVADLDDETYPSTPSAPARATPREKAAAKRAKARTAAADESAESDDPAEENGRATTPRKSARKRAAVPSWDDILFGTKSE